MTSGQLLPADCTRGGQRLEQSRNGAGCRKGWWCKKSTPQWWPLRKPVYSFWQETFSSPSLLWVRPCPNFPDQNCLKHLPKHRSAGLPLRPPGLEPHNQENCPSGTGVPWNADTQPMPQKVETRPVYVMLTEALGETTEQRSRPWRGQGVCRDAVWQPPLQWQVEGVREKGALIQFFLQWTVSKFFCARYVCVPRWDFVMIIFLC